MNPDNKKETETPEVSPLRQIRTFQGDVANTIGRQNESLVSIQRAQKSRNEAQGIEPASNTESIWEGKKTALLLVSSFILLALGVGGGWYAYQEYINKTTPPVITIPANRLISAAREVVLESATTTRSEIINAVSEASTSGAPLGEVTHINTSLTTTQFLNTLEAHPPGYLVRALEPTFMLGTLSGESAASTSVFLIIKVGSFENAFGGMLEWETQMPEDIGAMFSTRTSIREMESGLAFKDVIRRNKDSRVLYNAAGDAMLVYSFFDQDTLIITDSETTLETLLGRLANELLSR